MLQFKHMSQNLPFHQTQISADLKKTPFSIYFTDPDVERAWSANRLEVFKRVNKWAMLVVVGISILFFCLDVLLFSPTPVRLAFRVGAFLLGVLGYFVVGRTTSMRMGDRWILVLLGMLAMSIWHLIFLNLPLSVVHDYWLIFAAILAVCALTLFEIGYRTRIALTFVVPIESFFAISKLSYSWSDIMLSELHLLIVIVIGIMAAWQTEVARRLAFVGMLVAEEERARSVGLLRNILPTPIADQLLNTVGSIAERHNSVSVLFADIVGFTPFAGKLKAEQVVSMLDEVFTTFDRLCDQHGIEKIKTIGDAYMAAGGVPKGDGPHLKNIVMLGLDMLDASRQVSFGAETELKLRIGIHVGPVIAGVIGRQKFIYDLWGDTVNTAARMESHGVSGRIQVTAAVAEQLAGSFSVEPRGKIDIKGKGTMSTYLIGRLDED